MLLRASRINGEQSSFLDFVRGGAALLVLIAHCQQIFINPYWFPHKDLDVGTHLVLYRHLGSLGVMLFFVLSGFLIYQSIANNISGNENHEFDVRSFFISRLVRLYPPLLVVTGISLLVYFLLWFFGLNTSNEFSTGRELYLAREELVVNWKDIFGSLLFLNTITDQFRTPLINGPLWSLAHEFWFYALAAAIVLVYMNIRHVWLFFLVSIFLFFNVNSFFWYGFFVWCAGFISAFMWRFLHIQVAKYVSCFMFLTLFFCWCYALNESSTSYFYNNRNKFLFGLSFAFVLPVILNSTRLIKYVNKSRFCLLIGSVSPFAYTLYLIHFPIMLCIFAFSNKFVDGNLLLLIFQIVFSMGAAVIAAIVIGQVVEDKSRLAFMKEKISDLMSRTKKGAEVSDA